MLSSPERSAIHHGVSMAARYLLALIFACLSVIPALANGQAEPILACPASGPVAPRLCTQPVPAGLSSPLVPAVSMCLLNGTRLALMGCVLLPESLAIPPGGLFFETNVGVFVADAAAGGPRLYDSPGQTCNPGNTTSADSARCRPDALAGRIFAFSTEVGQQPPAGYPARFLPRTIVNIRMLSCATPGAGYCQPLPSLNAAPPVVRPGQ